MPLYEAKIPVRHVSAHAKKILLICDRIVAAEAGEAFICTGGLRCFSHLVKRIIWLQTRLGKAAVHVRFGSKSTFPRCTARVRFTPESGHR